MGFQIPSPNKYSPNACLWYYHMIRALFLSSPRVFNKHFKNRTIHTLVSYFNTYLLFIYNITIHSLVSWQNSSPHCVDIPSIGLETFYQYCRFKTKLEKSDSLIIAFVRQFAHARNVIENSRIAIIPGTQPYENTAQSMKSGCHHL